MPPEMKPGSNGSNAPTPGLASALLEGKVPEAQDVATVEATTELGGEPWDAAVGEAWDAVKADNREAFGRAIGNAVKIAMLKLGR